MTALKAGRNARSLVHNIYVNIKPRPVRLPLQPVGAADDGYDDYFEMDDIDDIDDIAAGMTLY